MLLLLPGYIIEMIEIDTNYVNHVGSLRSWQSIMLMMSASDVVLVLGQLRRAASPVWLDGGWGIDALLERQTREHDDLDCVIALSDTPATLTALTASGFIVTEDELPTRFAVRDSADRRVDFHTVTFDGDGGVQQLQDGSPCRYPPEAFLATGSVGGQAVRCITANVQLLVHLGYEPAAKDVHDMQILAARFALELTAPYRQAH